MFCHVTYFIVVTYSTVNRRDVKRRLTAKYVITAISIVTGPIATPPLTVHRNRRYWAWVPVIAYSTLGVIINLKKVQR